MKTLLKICGMKHNVAEVAAIQPDYMGFIFYEKSPRFFDGEVIPKLPAGIKKVGVFVDASVEEILEKVRKYNLNIIQLHGDESVDFCKKLKEGLDGARSDKSDTIEIWKVFSIRDKFDFEILKSYESIVDKFLFDTKGKEKGGNGFTFNWEILKNYPSKKPFILSGGIGLEEIESLKNLLKTDLPIHAIDVNSKFETAPGMKDVSALKSFTEVLKHYLKEPPAKT
ncbi:phosphoribosylanthranilate isomerase [Aequorivita antarctica]|uniref:N-(5'-phosphoribosyl)anthranilate isomerase n=2 Tax=Aequorivita antarctica TaxID=153266 RepID=A0A5C6YX70_9FLAO|nr:phosphoribosylanthranilate isomerase [Aequorivita antarctica]